MKLNIIITLILYFAILSCKSDFIVIENPSQYSKVIKRGKVIGAVFSENGECFMCLQNEKRFTPNIEEIESAETILRRNIKEINYKKINQGDKCLVIHRNLSKYRRQYFGYFNEKNEKIIFVTFNKNRLTFIEKLKGFYQYESDNWKKEKETWFDGCSNHWEIKINLTKKSLFELGINGSG